MRILIGTAVGVAVALAAAQVLAQVVAPRTTAAPAAASSNSGRSDRIELTPAQKLQARSSGTFDRDVKSILNVRRPLHYGEYIWDDKAVPAGPLWIRVDLDAQLISVFRAGEEIGTAVVLYGAEDKETPRGRFPVLAKYQDHRSATYDSAPMPYTLRLTGDGVSIHGSKVQWGRGTHGCIGVPVGFAKLLFAQAKKGDDVLIVGAGDMSHRT